LKYYDEENARWGYLNEIEPTESQVVSALRAWGNKLLRAGVSKNKPSRRKTRPFLVQWRHYREGYSWATEEEITLTYPVTWLTVIHEFAHLVEQRERAKNSRARYHGKRHRQIVDLLARDVIKRGLDVRSLHAVQRQNR